ncbi:MAG: GNAT family N-acetyltransferase [Firmicutes bacterium]|nr:GNAT family N-acetyltransferase [Bacillota bacterium]
MKHLRELHPKVITELIDKDFSYRLTEDDEGDIVKALEAIYSHYRYDYLHQALYDIDYFREIMRSGRYVAAVAENKSGQVMGFGALDAHPWFDGLMEMGGLVVNPIARGMGLGDGLDDFRIEIGRKRNIRGLFSTPIMQNPSSQKLLSRHGFIPTGMYFHAGGPESLGGSGDGIHPMDCGFGVYIYDKETEHTLYVPEDYRELIRDIFEEIGLNHSFAEPFEKQPVKTVMYLNHEVVSRLLEVRIGEIGQDYRERIGELPYKDEESDVEAIMLLVSMNDPLCPEFCEYLRGQGFFFTGCVPGGTNDLLVMQHLKYSIDRDYVKAEPDYAKVLNRLYEINGSAME